MATIATIGLSKDYGKGETLVRALDDVTLDIAQGEFVAIVGRSGSGKTTMLDCLGLLMRPTRGTIMLDGTDVGTLNDNQRAEIRSRRIGFIFQDFNLLPTMTAMENILLPLRYSGGDKKAARKRAAALLDQVGLAKRSHHRPIQMSGGESQRVAIARSLINQPSLVLGDEPMGQVDTDTANSLIALMRRINVETGASFVVVTHDLELAARADRVVRLRDGRVASDERTAAMPVRASADGQRVEVLAARAG